MKKDLIALNLRQNLTEAEKILWEKLKNRRLSGVKFRRQQPLKGYIIDFISFEMKLIIELDGYHHKDPQTIVKDEVRSSKLEQDGFTILRFWNGEIEFHLSDVLEKIEYFLHYSPSPGLSHQGRGIQR